jgi:RNA polymerase sigma-70 factor (ECF subfamily)
MAVAFLRMGPATATATASAQVVRNQRLSDEVLITRIASGNKLAMQMLFARYHVRIYRFALRIVRDETMAEDLISDVFLDVWRQAARFEARATVSTWLLAITKYKALSMLRRRSEDQLDCTLATTIEDPADNPEVAFQKKDSGEILRQCVAALSPEHGQIIDLVYYHGKSIREVAHIVGIPEATVKTRMFYARKRLAEQIKPA